ncbi:basic salivary proline-rich protein 4-like [Vulpes lagopus]|uniref:basic salivary proline-rich protein 4-like n=1 Tax=Vulpes lagopus TaxID=494514 RepID=UPI001BC92635|nr:basic salivary proline-rich protein 4-like [Vulpes lagopus]
MNRPRAPTHQKQQPRKGQVLQLAGLRGRLSLAPRTLSRRRRTRLASGAPPGHARQVLGAGQGSGSEVRSSAVRAGPSSRALLGRRTSRVKAIGSRGGPAARRLAPKPLPDLTRAPRAGPPPRSAHAHRPPPTPGRPRDTQLPPRLRAGPGPNPGAPPRPEAAPTPRPARPGSGGRRPRRGGRWAAARDELSRRAGCCRQVASDATRGPSRAESREPRAGAPGRAGPRTHASGRLRRGLPPPPPAASLPAPPARPPQAASAPSGPARRGPTHPGLAAPRVSDEERRLRNRQPPPAPPPPPPPASPARPGRARAAAAAAAATNRSARLGALRPPPVTDGAASQSRAAWPREAGTWRRRWPLRAPRASRILRAGPGRGGPGARRAWGRGAAALRSGLPAGQHLPREAQLPALFFAAFLLFFFFSASPPSVPLGFAPGRPLPPGATSRPRG